MGTHPPGLIEFIVKERLFNFFLVNGCIPATSEYKLETRISEENPWPRPVKVYGYDDSWPVAGDLFEAETDCNRQRNSAFLPLCPSPLSRSPLSLLSPVSAAVFTPNRCPNPGCQPPPSLSR